MWSRDAGDNLLPPQPPTRMTAVRLGMLLLLLMGCRQEMYDQPRYDPLQESAFFEDGRSARPLVPGTVPRGRLRDDAHLYTGMVDGVFADTFPFPITQGVLQRGMERYNIHCAPCHDRVGTGQGMVVRRGFTRPTSFHADRLRQAPPGFFFDAITAGFGVMPNYADQVAVRDRWAIVAYIRALQLSQRATLADVPVETQQQLQEKTP